MTNFTCTINNVATRKRPKPEYGQRLEARRRVIGKKSLDDIVKETDGRIYKQLWYRIENGLKAPKSLTPSQISDFALVLEWSLQELASALEITLPVSATRATNTDIGSSTVPIRSVGTRNGDDENVPIDMLGRYKPEDCIVVVADDSVLAIDAIRLRNGEPEKGRRFVVCSSLKPSEGKIVAYCVKGSGTYILTTYCAKPLVEPPIVRSYDGSSYLVLELGKPELEFVGTLIVDYKPWWLTDEEG